MCGGGATLVKWHHLVVIYLPNRLVCYTFISYEQTQPGNFYRPARKKRLQGDTLVVSAACPTGCLGHLWFVIKVHLATCGCFQLRGVKG